MKTPGPNHPITISPTGAQVRVLFDQHPLAASDKALSLKEADYPVVQYLPREDIEMGYMTKTAHHTTCPYKGEASYFTIFYDGQLLENAAWSYETPYPAMEAIKEMIAFYPNTFRIEVGAPAAETEVSLPSG
jgi:uncharacterized protein (DUF427 family)